MSNFDECLKLVLHHEGGYVNHPKDPGGETNMGVTKRVYEKWCMENDLEQKDMKDLEFDDVAPIYKKNYWDRVKADQLPEGLDLCVFDWAVNSGTGRAAKKLQAMIGTTVDGGMVSKEEIIKRIKKDMLTKGYLNKYSSCLSKPTPRKSD